LQPSSPNGRGDSEVRAGENNGSKIHLSKLDKLKNLQKKQIFTKKYVLIQG